jgi:hypothetical protein
MKQAVEPNPGLSRRLLSACVLSALMLVAPMGCDSSPEPSEEAQLVQDDPLVDLTCVRFKWVDAAGIANRAAILVPVVAGGATLRFQLDTGATVSMIPGGAAGKFGIEHQYNREDGNWYTTPIDLELAGGQFPGREVFVDPELTRSEPAGTVGLDLLEGKIVVLDLAGMRFCLNEPDAPGVAAMLDKADFTPARFRDGKLFVEARLGDEAFDDLFYDTGASAFPLQVDLPFWKQLTGLNGDEESNTRWEVRSPEKTITFVGAPAVGSLEIGQARIESPMVYFREDQPELFAAWEFSTRGFIGNVPFLEHVVVLDLRPEASRFGIIAAPTE